MTFKIGFTASEEEPEAAPVPAPAFAAPEERLPRRSVVRVHFPQRNMTLAYYNDRFDLRYGDIVYVDGKLEGKLGRVEEVNYNFRIDLADYKRVIAVVDTTVSGRFYLAGSHFLTFDRTALPREKVVSWFKAPPKPDAEYVSGSDESGFSLDNLNGMRIDAATAGRGCSYYAENRVRYLCLDGTKGYALVEGTKPYDVEFEFSDGMIRSLTCSCYCAGACKHEYAAMRQMQELFDGIKKNHGEEYIQNRYFAAVTREILFSCALHGRNTGTLTLDPPVTDASDVDEEFDGEAISGIEETYRGTKTFRARNIRDVFRNKTVNYTDPHDGGIGISQNDPSVKNDWKIDLSAEDWFVYTDNYGTSEEKAFVAYFRGYVADLRKIYDRIFLVRNEREFHIYSFEDGERFEPDYVLFLQKNKMDGFEQLQIFIEPKGTQLLEKDAWKEKFLLQLKAEAVPTTIFVDDNDYKIWGLHFFNQETRMKEFDSEFAALIGK